MKLSDLKWWHWTAATIVLAVAIRVATGGPLPFLGRVGAPAPGPTASAPAGRPARAPNTGPQIRAVVNQPGFEIDGATPERDRLTIDASIPNPGTGLGLVEQSGILVKEIAKALQGGVSEDSSAVTEVRILVATRGADRTGKSVAHLSLYSLAFKASDLFGLKSDASPAQALGLAQNVVFNDPQAHKAMRDWCGAPANLNDALAFCGRVTAAKGV
ncbi:MAG: hypothetical protein ACXU82_12725 [Caulobacteraceae bacterium]